MYDDEDNYSAFDPSTRAVTLYDLYREIQRDPALSVFEGRQLVNQLQGITQQPSFTPLERLGSQGLGGVAGYMVGKYFDMGPVGKALTTAIGLGVGKRVYDQFNKPPEQMRGWKILE